MFDVFDKPGQEEQLRLPVDFVDLILLDPQPRGVMAATVIGRSLRSFYMGRVPGSTVIDTLCDQSVDQLKLLIKEWPRCVRICPAAEWKSLCPIMSVCEKCYRRSFCLHGAKFCMGTYCAVEHAFLSGLRCGLGRRCQSCFCMTEDSSGLCCGKAQCVVFFLCLYKITTAYGYVFRWKYN